MKKFLLILTIWVMSIVYSFSQITVDHVYTVPPGTTFSAFNFSYYGLKYYSEYPYMNVQYFVLYNPDYSIFRTINVPPIAGKTVWAISYVSDALFDTDSLIEYMLQYQDSATGYNDFAILNENGNQLLYVDHAYFLGDVANSVDQYRGFIDRPIFPDGNQTKLYMITNTDSSTWTPTVYNLPGHLACLECYGANGINEYANLSDKSGSLAYPNPASDYVRIKYSLPSNCKYASINLYDISGKLIKQKEIETYLHEVYISTEEINQGAYSYEIVADSKRISYGKIIKL